MSHGAVGGGVIGPGFSGDGIERQLAGEIYQQGAGDPEDELEKLIVLGMKILAAGFAIWLGALVLKPILAVIGFLAFAGMVLGLLVIGPCALPPASAAASTLA